ncbi:MAG: DUF4105 domain-containing protein [Bradymonadia bacterium]
MRAGRQALPLVISLLLCIPSVCFASPSCGETLDLDTNDVARNDAEKATHPQWLALLHMRPDCMGHMSEIDSPEFFISPEGVGDPLAEYHATRAAFEEGRRWRGTPDERPQCRWPDRYNYVAQMERWSAPRGPCPALDAYLRRVRPSAVSLVFSHYFLNNPASALGHVFLRLRQGGVDEGASPELLDTAVNFSADTGNADPVAYMLLGALGGFPGRFGLESHHEKVRTYAHFEHRDLWTYDLTLTEAEVKRLVLHLWAMQQAFFDYYFFDENCAYHLAGLLDAAAPRLQLKRDFGVVIMPVELLLAVAKRPELVGAVQHQPSMRRLYVARVESLDASERLRFEQLIEPNTPLEVDEVPPAALDAALRHFELFWPHTLTANSVEQMTPERLAVRRRRRALVQARMSVGEAPAPLLVDRPWLAAPETGHGTQRLRLMGVFDGKAAGAIAHRWALHDLADPQGAYPIDGAVEFTRIEGQVDDEGRVELRRGQLFRVLSLSDVSGVSPSISWGAQGGLEPLPIEEEDVLYGGLAAQVGGSLSGNVWGLVPRVTLFALGEVWVGSPVSKQGRWLPLGGPVGGLRLMLSPGLNVVLRGAWRVSLLDLQPVGWSAEGVLRGRLSDHWALEIGGRGNGDVQRAAAGLVIYW